MQAKIPPPILAATLAAAMVAAAKSPIALPISTGANGWIALGLLTFGLAVAGTGVLQFRQHQTTVDPLHPDRASHLVTGGVYRFTRNPMYLGLLCLLLALGMWLGSGAALIVAALLVPVLNTLQIGAEEAAMQHLFGDAFDDYASRVRRWL